MEYPEKEKQRNKRFLKTLGLSVSRNWSVLLVYMPLRVAQTKAILVLKSMSERGGSDMQRF